MLWHTDAPGFIYLGRPLLLLSLKPGFQDWFLRGQLSHKIALDAIAQTCYNTLTFGYNCLK